MKMIAWLLVCVFCCFVFNFICLLVGFILYFLGFKRSGFYLLAVHGISGRWLSSHCPYSDSCDCHIWTCSSYSSCPRRLS